MSHHVQFCSERAGGFHEVAPVASTLGVCTFDIRNTARQKRVICIIQYKESSTKTEMDKSTSKTLRSGNSWAAAEKVETADCINVYVCVLNGANSCNE